MAEQPFLSKSINAKIGDSEFATKYTENDFSTLAQEIKGESPEKILRASGRVCLYRDHLSLEFSKGSLDLRYSEIDAIELRFAQLQIHHHSSLKRVCIIRSSDIWDGMFGSQGLFYDIMEISLKQRLGLRFKIAPIMTGRVFIPLSIASMVFTFILFYWFIPIHVLAYAALIGGMISAYFLTKLRHRINMIMRMQ
jgi:hypothetical protein